MTTEKRNIPIMKPFLGEEEINAVRGPLSTGWVTQGPEVAKFEEEFCEYVGASHACAVSNGTAALQLSLLAVGVEPDDEVITVSHSFIASANSIRHCGAVPVFADIDPVIFNIDPSKIEPLINERTKAILCVHQIGMPCDLNAILEIAGRHSLAVVEDAACAIGSEISVDGSWQKIGRPHGDVACFSFHPRKTLTTGEGGMITTNRHDVIEKLRLLRHQGMVMPSGADAQDENGNPRVVDESFPIVGYNCRMTDIQAAIGRVQLSRLPEMLDVRREQARHYHAAIEDIDGVVAPVEPEWARSNWQSYCVRLDDRLDRRAVMQAMLDRGVSTRRGIACAHREPAYPEGTWKCAEGDAPLAESERARDQCVILPIYHTLAREDQDYVIEELREAVALAKNPVS